MTAAQMELAATALYGIAALLLVGLVVAFIRAYREDRRRDLMEANRPPPQ
jgi:hypothetical protein